MSWNQSIAAVNGSKHCLDFNSEAYLLKQSVMETNRLWQWKVTEF